MTLTFIRKKLARLRDEIKAQGRLSDEHQAELKALMEETLMSAETELTAAQEKLAGFMALKAANTNRPLSPEQTARLKIIEKSGAMSGMIH